MGQQSHASELCCVSDNDRAAGAIQRLLSIYEGYQVTTAPAGPAGLALARDHPPDLAILDIMMPGMDGLEVLHRLRAADPQLPVILLTALARSSAKHPALPFIGQPLPNAAPALLDVGIIQVLQCILVGLGILGSLYAAYRIATSQYSQARAWLAFAPYVVPVAVLGAMNIYLFVLPMAMRMLNHAFGGNQRNAIHCVEFGCGLAAHR